MLNAVEKVEEMTERCVQDLVRVRSLVGFWSSQERTGFEISHEWGQDYIPTKINKSLMTNHVVQLISCKSPRYLILSGYIHLTDLLGS